MKVDLYADLASLTACPANGPLPGGLAAGFMDGCTSWSARGNDEKNDARRCYMNRASSGKLTLPDALGLEPRAVALPEDSWIAFEIAFTLATPWYSKDDRPFHVLDNPVRKDRVFGVPYMSAASWKGLLRWACRMQDGLNKEDPAWVIDLFGNEKGEAEEFRRGALAFRPTWFSKIGFEVINPHSRRTRAGTQPIVYEVVPPGTPGVLRVLYAPVPGVRRMDGVRPAEAIESLVGATEQLLTLWGISAKRTAGWGTANVTEWRAHRNGKPPIKTNDCNRFTQDLKSWLGHGGAR